MAAAAVVGSHTSVQLHATEVVAELVANISQGELTHVIHAALDSCLLMAMTSSSDNSKQKCPDDTLHLLTETEMLIPYVRSKISLTLLMFLPAQHLLVVHDILDFCYFSCAIAW